MCNNSSTWQRRLRRFADSTLGIIHHLWIIHSACLGEHTTESKCGISVPFQGSPLMSLLPSLAAQQRAGALVAGERIVQVIQFSAKAPWIIETRGGRACSSFAVDSDYHVYTNRWRRVRKHTYTCTYSLLHKARTHTHTQTTHKHYCQALGYAALWEAISHHYLAVWSGSLPHYLLYNQLWLQNNLIPLTGTPRCVVAMPARCPAPGYSFTPLYLTQSGSYVYP